MIARYKWHFLVCVIFLLAVLYCVKTATTAPFNSSNNPASATPSNFYADNGEEKIADLLTVRIRREVALEGEKAIYDIFDRKGVKIGSAIYPYEVLNNGDIIFGRGSFYTYYSKQDDRLIPLREVLGGYEVYTYNYLADKNQIAFSGMKGNSLLDFMIIKDMNSGKSKIIDSSRVLEGTEPSGCACSWAPDGKLFYTIVINNKRAIKLYDPAPDKTSLYMNNALLSGVSPDGRYLSYVSLPDQNEVLVDLKSGKTVAQLAGYFVCWDKDGNYIITGYDSPNSLHVYDLNSRKKVKDISIEDGLLGDVSCEQGVLKVAVFHMQGEQISSVAHAQYQIR